MNLSGGSQRSESRHPPVAIALATRESRDRLTNSPLTNLLPWSVEGIADEEWRAWTDSLPVGLDIPLGMDFNGFLRKLKETTNDFIPPGSTGPLGFAREFCLFDSAQHHSGPVHLPRCDSLFGLQVLNFLVGRMGLKALQLPPHPRTKWPANLGPGTTNILNRLADWHEVIVKATDIVEKEREKFQPQTAVEASESESATRMRRRRALWSNLSNGVRKTGRFTKIATNLSIAAFLLGWYFSGKFQLPKPEDVAKEFSGLNNDSLGQDNGLDSIISRFGLDVPELEKYLRDRTHQPLTMPLRLGLAISPLLFVIPILLRDLHLQTHELISIFQSFGNERPAALVACEEVVWHEVLNLNEGVKGVEQALSDMVAKWALIARPDEEASWFQDLDKYPKNSLDARRYRAADSEEVASTTLLSPNTLDPADTLTPSLNTLYPAPESFRGPSISMLSSSSWFSHRPINTVQTPADPVSHNPISLEALCGFLNVKGSDKVDEVVLGDMFRRYINYPVASGSDPTEPSITSVSGPPGASSPSNASAIESPSAMDTELSQPEPSITSVSGPPGASSPSSASAIETPSAMDTELSQPELSITSVSGPPGASSPSSASAIETPSAMDTELSQPEPSITSASEPPGASSPSNASAIETSSAMDTDLSQLEPSITSVSGPPGASPPSSASAIETPSAMDTELSQPELSITSASGPPGASSPSSASAIETPSAMDTELSQPEPSITSASEPPGASSPSNAVAIETSSALDTEGSGASTTQPEPSKTTVDWNCYNTRILQIEQAEVFTNGVLNLIEVCLRIKAPIGAEQALDVSRLDNIGHDRKLSNSLLKKTTVTLVPFTGRGSSDSDAAPASIAARGKEDNSFSLDSNTPNVVLVTENHADKEPVTVNFNSGYHGLGSFFREDDELSDLTSMNSDGEEAATANLENSSTNPSMDEDDAESSVDGEHLAYMFSTLTFNPVDPAADANDRIGEEDAENDNNGDESTTINPEDEDPKYADKDASNVNAEDYPETSDPESEDDDDDIIEIEMIDLSSDDPIVIDLTGDDRVDFSTQEKASRDKTGIKIECYSAFALETWHRELRGSHTKSHHPLSGILEESKDNVYRVAQAFQNASLRSRISVPDHEEPIFKMWQNLSMRADGKWQSGCSSIYSTPWPRGVPLDLHSIFETRHIVVRGLTKPRELDMDLFDAMGISQQRLLSMQDLSLRTTDEPKRGEIKALAEDFIQEAKDAQGRVLHVMRTPMHLAGNEDPAAEVR
ncbi:hypothetical protein C8R43DRAFT_951526 [Mycena crocata]|nr:hypothetical protein C8R43DRAFT_951526 [Mycena crocata]